MSDLMLFGVLQMPYEMAMNDELSRVQFYQRAQQALDRIAELEKDLHMIQRHYDQLNTHPVELTDEEIIKTANSLGLIHAYDTDGQWSGITNEPLFDSEKQRNNERLLEILKPFTDAILRKAQEK